MCSTQQVAAKDSVTAYILCDIVPKVKFVLRGRLQKGNKSPFCQNPLTFKLSIIDLPRTKMKNYILVVDSYVLLRSHFLDPSPV